MSIGDSPLEFSFGIKYLSFLAKAHRRGLPRHELGQV